MNKKGRDRRRFIKRRQLKKSKKPICGRYDLNKLLNMIIVVKERQVLYTGRLIKYEKKFLHPNLEYYMITLDLKNSQEKFYVLKSIDEYLKFRQVWRQQYWWDKEFHYTKIIKILSKLNAVIFQMQEE